MLKAYWCIWPGSGLEFILSHPFNSFLLPPVAPVRVHYKRGTAASSTKDHSWLLSVFYTGELLTCPLSIKFQLVFLGLIAQTSAKPCHGLLHQVRLGLHQVWFICRLAYINKFDLQERKKCGLLRSRPPCDLCTECWRAGFELMSSSGVAGEQITHRYVSCHMLTTRLRGCYIHLTRNSIY